MVKDDLIDKKINALLNFKEDSFDLENENDFLCYSELRDFAESHEELLYLFNNEVYLIVNFIGEKKFLIIPVNYSL